MYFEAKKEVEGHAIYQPKSKVTTILVPLEQKELERLCPSGMANIKSSGC
jgi:hypothetical protein